MFRYYSTPNEAAVRITVAGEHSDGVLKLAVSRCSMKDRYVKKIGREKAEKRLSIGLLYDQIELNECDAKTFVVFAKKAVLDIDKNAKVVRILPKGEKKVKTPAKLSVVKDDNGGGI